MKRKDKPRYRISPKRLFRRRLNISLVVISLAFLLSGVMCVKCTVFADSSLSVLSGQYTSTVMLSYPRGTIYDQNGIPFTNRSYDGLNFFTISDNSGSGVASYITGDVLIDAGNTTASGAKGVSGLQKAYDSLLNGGAPVEVSAYIDAKGNRQKDSGYYVKNDHLNEGCSIRLTLDYNLQKAFEEALKEHAEEKGYSGLCAVLSEVKSGKVITMASYGGYMNNAVLSYQPGSIMKIITAAAAYENEIIDENSTYICDGSVDVDGKTRGCMHGAVHGEMLISEAFARSCNCCFFDLASKLVYKDENGEERSYMMDLAKKWGFCEYEKIAGERFVLEYDDHPSFVCSDIYNKMDVFNAALGQGKIQASPYLINKITAAVAAGGETTGTYIVEEIKDAAGNIIGDDKDGKKNF